MNSERWDVNVEFLWIASHKAWWGLSSVRCLCLSFFFFLAMLSNLWDLRSLTRDHTCGPLHWKHEALTTRLPGKSQKFYFWLCLSIRHKLTSDSFFFSPISQVPLAKWMTFSQVLLELLTHSCVTHLKADQEPSVFPSWTVLLCMLMGERVSTAHSFNVYSWSTSCVSGTGQVFGGEGLIRTLRFDQLLPWRIYFSQRTKDLPADTSVSCTPRESLLVYRVITHVLTVDCSYRPSFHSAQESVHTEQSLWALIFKQWTTVYHSKVVSAFKPEVFCTSVASSLESLFPFKI